MNELVTIPGYQPLPPRLVGAVQTAMRILAPRAEGEPERLLGPADISHDPLAAEQLAQRRKLLAPADQAVCRAWLDVVAGGVNGVTDNDIERRAGALWIMCGKMPAFVWCEATVSAIWEVTRFLPTAGEVHRVLTAHAAPLVAEIAALEAIANAPRRREVYGEESPVPYQIPMPPDWVGSREVRGPAEYGERPSKAVPPQRTIEQQLIELGFTPKKGDVA